MNNESYYGTKQSFQGFYKVKIVNAITDEIAWESDWNKNLILNQGMEAIGSINIANLTICAVAGGGTRNNQISGGTSEITQSGNTAYLNLRTGLPDFTSPYAPYSSVVQVGDIIKYSNNSESMVTTIIDSYNLTLTTNYTFTAGQTFTIWKTSQVGLLTEVKRAGGGIANTNYVSGVGKCDTTTDLNTRTWRRTYDFAPEVAQSNYNELGVAWATSGPTTVFSRIKLDSTIIVEADFKLRMIYDLVGTFTPMTEIYTQAGIGGWPVLPATDTWGSESLQNFLTSTIDNNGTTTGTPVLDPASITPFLFASTNSASLAVFGSAVNRSIPFSGVSNALSIVTHFIDNDYYTFRTGVFPTSQANYTTIKSVGMGSTSSPATAANTAIAFKFNQSQSKTNMQTLSLTYKSSWSRILN